MCLCARCPVTWNILMHQPCREPTQNENAAGETAEPSQLMPRHWCHGSIASFAIAEGPTLSQVEQQRVHHLYHQHTPYRHHQEAKQERPYQGLRTCSLNASQMQALKRRDVCMRGFPITFSSVMICHDQAQAIFGFGADALYSLNIIQYQWYSMVLWDNAMTKRDFMWLDYVTGALQFFSSKRFMLPHFSDASFGLHCFRAKVM